MNEDVLPTYMDFPASHVSLQEGISNFQNSLLLYARKVFF